ncbi:MAG: DUF3793 family protein [Lachnospiraceae bacterium]|nr:DUF3793 family protein [Lachnospiraceae bacterium]
MVFEPYLVEYCSPTLASLKTANLFSIGIKDMDELYRNIEAGNKKLNPKGVYLELLKVKNGRGLIYVYRKKSLETDLEKEEVRTILSLLGYKDINLKNALDHLKQRLFLSDDFPHEIGLFLGYPPKDVLGFILNGGMNEICTGCWKVYCDECESRRCFDRFNKCKNVYMRLFSEGRPITNLTVNN